MAASTSSPASSKRKADEHISSAINKKSKTTASNSSKPETDERTDSFTKNKVQGKQEQSEHANKISKEASGQDEPKRPYVLFKWFLLLFIVTFCMIFGIQCFYLDSHRYVKFFTVLFFFNMVILTYHLERRKRSLEEGGWKGSSESDKQLMYVFNSSKVRALSAANISFVTYFAVFKLTNNFIRCVRDEKTSACTDCVLHVFRGLGPEIADLFTLVTLAAIIICIIYASCWQQYIRTRHLSSTDHRCWLRSLPVVCCFC